MFPPDDDEGQLLFAFGPRLLQLNTVDELTEAWTAFTNQFGVAQDIADRLFTRVLEKFQLRPLDSSVTENSEPCLHVDLGPHFKVGHALAVEFHLICPGYLENPTVDAQLRGPLDRAHWVEAPDLHMEKPGFWTFTEQFALKDPLDPSKSCSEGSYRIEVNVSFPTAPSGSLGRFLRAGLRFHVPPATESDPSRTLEIDGDGLSIIELDRIQDLSSFGRVVIKGRDKSIISLTGTEKSVPPIQQASAVRHFKLPFKRHHERCIGPFVSPKIHRSAHAHSGVAFNFTGGGRYLVFPKESLQFGRGEKNDVVLRFVPGSSDGLEPQYSQNDVSGKDISRKHFAVSLTRTGLTLTDLGSTLGTRCSEQLLSPNQPHVIKAIDPGVPQELHVANKFRLMLSSYSNFGSDESLPTPPSDDHVDAVVGPGSSLPRTWILAQHPGIDAARVSRITNLVTEHYVMLFRQAIIGFSSSCALSTPCDDGLDHMARLIYIDDHFWIERLAEPRKCELSVDGHQLQAAELVPVIPGQKWQFGGSSCVIELPRQDLSGFSDISV